MNNRITLMIRTFGPLRLALITLVLVDLILRPVPGAPADFEGASVIPDLIAPVLSPILLMLLLLDAIMTGVYMSGMEGDRRIRYRYVLLTNLALAAFFIWYWVPYFKALNF